jgi:PAS domain S-box-containing protein
VLRLPTLIVAATLALVALIWVAAIGQVRHERTLALEDSTERQNNQAIAFEEYTNRTLDNARALMHYVLRELNHTRGPLDMPQLLRDVGIEGDAFDAVSVVDRYGTVTSQAGEIIPATPINISDREHFFIHRDHDNVGLFIGKPVLSRRTGTMMVPLTQRIDRDGVFDGVVSVQFDPARFTAFSSAATIRPRDVWSLVGLDGITRARRVGERHSTGEDIAGSGLFEARAVAPVGAYTGPGRLDNVERVYAYRTLRDYPLVATVGVATEDILADTMRRRRLYFGSAAAISLGLGTAAWILVVTVVRRRQTYEALLASQRRLRALFEFSNDSILLADATTRLIDANPSACTLLGYPRDEVLRLKLTDITLPDVEEAVLEQWQQFVAQGRSGGDMRIRRGDGQVREIDYTAVANIEPGIHLAVFRDVTERKAVERQSLRKQRMESLGTLAGGIAHDLNNALSPILMSIALLQDDEHDPDRRGLLDTINTSAQRGADMVRQVLSFARGVEGRREALEFLHVVHDIERIVNDTFLKTIEVRVRIADGLPPVVGDPTQIHQVLLNLCVNARDAMPSGGVLTISASVAEVDDALAAQHPGAQAGRYVVLGVEDTGTGIPAGTLDRIFEPFYTTKETGQGTGLGLSTSLAIVNSHEGFIRVRSDQGKGTWFGVYLPVSVSHNAETAAPAAPTPPRGSGEVVLVIDDEEAIRRVMARTLEAFGYSALTASGGAEGVALYTAQAGSVSAVITDMMMPGMEGGETMVALRGVNPAVRIIAASGLVDDSVVARAFGAGARIVLPKPFTAETLLRAVREVLDEAAPAAASGD